MRDIKVAIAGLGFVGRETVRLLAANRERFRARLGADVVLTAVADRDAAREAKALGLPQSIARLRDPQELLRRPDVDVVVELLGGLEAPQKLALAALSSGRHVVTANKRLLAYGWDKLQAAGAAGRARLYFEASVAGGIPVLQALDNSFAANRIEAVYGILNGTTNYILTCLEKGGISFEEALRQAQEKGFAEKDPRMDLSGEDTAQKVSVLASLLTGRALPPEKIARSGITGIAQDDVAFALGQLKRTPRLLGSLRLDWGKTVRLEAQVFPTLVPLDHPLAAVRREYNALLVKASSAADLMFYGKGAGPGPTASAVVGDIFMLSRDILGGIPVARRQAHDVTLVPASQSVSAFYLRLFAEDKPGVLAQVTAALGRRGISIASIHQSGIAQKPGAAGLGRRPRGTAPHTIRRGVPVVITTHPAEQGRFTGALKEILSLRAVARPHTVMRML